MGLEGLDAKHPRGKYPREAWPWDRPDPHDDVAAYPWARPADWDGVSAYDGTNKLNTSIYEMCVQWLADCSALGAMTHLLLQ